MNIEIIIAVPGNTPPDLEPRIFPTNMITIGKTAEGKATVTQASQGGFSGIPTFCETYEDYATVRARVGTLTATAPVALASSDDMTAAVAGHAALSEG